MLLSQHVNKHEFDLTELLLLSFIFNSQFDDIQSLTVKKLEVNISVSDVSMHLILSLL